MVYEIVVQTVDPARRDEYVEHAETGATTPPSGSTGRVEAQAQGLSVQLVVPDKSDVKGDGTPARLFVAKTRLKAAFAFRTVPKLYPYVFRVADGATKPEIKAAVELLFKTRVDEVRVARVKGKAKRFGRFAGRRRNWKKAYVRLAAGQEINFGTME